MTLKNISLLMMAGCVLAACGSSGKSSPNEFEVVSRAPLAIPPESDLAPPRPGQPTPQAIDPGQRAFEALFPGKKFPRPANKSEGENAILSQLAPSSPDIRSNVAQKDLQVVRKRLLLADLLEAEERQFAPDNVEIDHIISDRLTGDGY